MHDPVGEGVGFFKLDRASLPALRAAIDASDPEGDYEAAVEAFSQQFKPFVLPSVENSAVPLSAVEPGTLASHKPC